MADLLLSSRGIASIHASTHPTAQEGPEAKTALDTTTRTLSSLPRPLLNAIVLVRRGTIDLLRRFSSWDAEDEEIVKQCRMLEERKRSLRLRMKTADCLKQWHAAAQELDRLEGHDAWKETDFDESLANHDESDDSLSGYEPKLITQRLHELDHARANGDVRAMMHLVRTALARDTGGMGDVDLYRQSYVGTKRLIERYVESAVQTVDAVVVQSCLGEHGPNDSAIEAIESGDRMARDFLESMLLARQSFGRSALLLSGGGTFGMTHVGVLKALFEARLLPRIISGASAGSIVSAVICTRTDEEIPAVLRDFPYGNLAVFEAEDRRLGLLDHLRRLLTHGSWSDIDNLTGVMRGLTGDLTFQEAYNRTRRILNICVSTASLYELPRLLNYITAPNVMIWSAVAASCSVPFVFNSSPLLVKDPLTGEHSPWNPTPQRFIDGSVDNDLPMTRLAEMFNVNHFIVSQVNPHVVPFLSKHDHLSADVDAGSISSRERRQQYRDWSGTLASLAKGEALHRLQFMADMGFFPNLMTKCQSVLSQRYSGDITILPEISLNDLPRLMSNPDADYLVRSALLGEKATWPKLSRIRDCCAIELALDRAVHRLRARVVFSEGKSKLRATPSPAADMRIQPPISISIQAPPATELPPCGRSPRRQRRRSGGSVQITGDARWRSRIDYANDDKSEDGNTDQRVRRDFGRCSVLVRKPRLKRASRSHVQVPQYRQTGSAKAVDKVTAKFDFSHPVNSPGLPGQLDGQAISLNPSKSPSPMLWEHQSTLVRSMAASPTDEMETSEQGHSSDADADFATEESDPDPYDGHSRGIAAVEQDKPDGNAITEELDSHIVHT